MRVTSEHRILYCSPNPVPARVVRCACRLIALGDASPRRGPLCSWQGTSTRQSCRQGSLSGVTHDLAQSSGRVPIGTGIKFDLAALTRDLTTMLLVPTFLLLFLIVRGGPVLLYRRDLARDERMPFALFTAVASLSLVVVITEIGVRARGMSPDIAAALVGAAVLSVLLFPTAAGILLSRNAVGARTTSRSDQAA